jgi:hypothetical protein
MRKANMKDSLCQALKPINKNVVEKNAAENIPKTFNKV